MRNKAPWLLLLLAVATGVAVFLAQRPELVGGPEAVTPVGQGRPPHNVVLLSWDGAGRDVVNELLEQKKLPSLAALIAEGSLRPIEVTGHATSTMPGHAQMLTGLDPRLTGVFSNYDAQPLPEGCTIFERVQKAFGRDKIATLCVTGKRAFGSIDPEVPPTSLLSICGRSFDYYDAANRESEEVADLALEAFAKIGRHRRFLAFFHFMDPDYAAHGQGSGSETYREAIVGCDKALGRIVQWLKARRRHDATLIYVTADHAFDPDAEMHDDAPGVWLATNDKLVTRGGFQADIPATILARLGLDLDKLEPRLLGKPLTGVEPAAVTREDKAAVGASR